MSTALETERGVERQKAVRKLRRDVEKRFCHLSTEDLDDLKDLAELLKGEADPDARKEIVRTIMEFVVPPWFRGEADEAEEDESVARERLTDYRKKVGKEIRKHRRAMGLTQQQLAEKAGLPQSHICRLEKGQHTPTHITIERLATALEVRAAELDPGFND